jgi:hypothetical protein
MIATLAPRPADPAALTNPSKYYPGGRRRKEEEEGGRRKEEGGRQRWAVRAWCGRGCEGGVVTSSTGTNDDQVVCILFGDYVESPVYLSCWINPVFWVDIVKQL